MRSHDAILEDVGSKLEELLSPKAREPIEILLNELRDVIRANNEHADLRWFADVYARDHFGRLYKTRDV